MLLAEETTHAVEAAGWFVDHAWLIPVIPAIAYALILLFGKRLPRGGSELGIGSMAIAFVLSAGTAFQWVSYNNAAHHEAGAVIKSWTWWQSGGLTFGIGQHIDGLAVTMLLLVTFISTLVQIYSTEYVAGDRRYTFFFSSLTLFSAGMLAMVLAPNMVQLILGWEIMGLCSFMLIGHWWEEGANSRAALKAFFTVRVGDMGLLVGTAILLAILGTLDIGAINAITASPDFHSDMLKWAAVALFIACIGKSGQFPLHTWLPDAMAGPTPVSSLLHSSTMVVAGVFLVARLYPVFHVGLDINLAGQQINLIAAIGGITVLVAAILAFVQNDIKKVLAYSTVSQLGYMMMALGVGAWTAGVFHIFTHAFFKCALFLIAGSISHTASHHSFDMKTDMGGIRKKMPVSFGSWMVATAALCGIPFFSGFFSKDEIIDSAKHNGYTMFYYAGIIGAFMTAAYMTRATYLTWYGKPRGAAAHFMHTEPSLLPEQIAAGMTVDAVHDDHGATHLVHGDDDGVGTGHDEDEHVSHGKPLPFAPHDSPWRITVPILILAILAFGSGYINAPALNIFWFEHQTESSIGLPINHESEGEHAAGDEEGEAAAGEEAGHGDEAAGASDEEHAVDAVHSIPAPPKFSWANAAPGLILVALGILVSWFVSAAVFGFKKNPLVGLTRRSKLLGGLHSFLVNKLYLDWLYENVFVYAIAHPIAKAAYWTNQHIIDAIVNGVGRFTKRVGTDTYKYIDQGVIDGAVNLSGTAANEGGHALQPVQSGKISQYGALLFGAATVGAIVLIIVNV